MVFVIQLCLLLLFYTLRFRDLNGLGMSAPGDDKRRVQMIGYHKGRLTRCQFGLQEANVFPFIVRTERWYHRWLKAIGLAEEIRMGDDMLDQHLYFITDYPDRIEPALRSQALRETIKTLFLNKHVKALYVTDKRSWVVLKLKGLNNIAPDGADYWEALHTLTKQTQNIEAARTVPKVTTRSKALLFIAAHSTLMMTGVLAFLPTLIDDMNTLDRAAWIYRASVIAIAAIGVWFALILAFFGRTSWAGWVIFDFLLAGVLGIWLCSLHFTREANIHFDRNAPQVISQPVVQRTCTVECQKSCGRRCTRRSSYPIAEAECTPAMRPSTLARLRQTDYICQSSARYELRVYVKDWRADNATYSFEPNETIYDVSQIGTAMDVPLHPGALSIPWVDDASIAPSQ